MMSLEITECCTVEPTSVARAVRWEWGVFLEIFAIRELTLSKRLFNRRSERNYQYQDCVLEKASGTHVLPYVVKNLSVL